MRKIKKRLIWFSMHVILFIFSMHNEFIIRVIMLKDILGKLLLRFVPI